MSIIEQRLAQIESPHWPRIVYGLGFGGMQPDAPGPGVRVSPAALFATVKPEQQAKWQAFAQSQGVDVRDTRESLLACDCSGFVCWVLGISRKQPGTRGTREGGWIDTTAIYDDAVAGPNHRFRVVAAHEARRGDLIVYRDGAKPGAEQGHVGVLTAVAPQREDWRVVHCAPGNMLETGAAVAVTDTTIFEVPGDAARVVRFGAL